METLLPGSILRRGGRFGGPREQQEEQQDEQEATAATTTENAQQQQQQDPPGARRGRFDPDAVAAPEQDGAVGDAAGVEVGGGEGVAAGGADQGDQDGSLVLGILVQRRRGQQQPQPAAVQRGEQIYRLFAL